MYGEGKGEVLVMASLERFRGTFIVPKVYHRPHHYMQFNMQKKEQNKTKKNHTTRKRAGLCVRKGIGRTRAQGERGTGQGEDLQEGSVHGPI